MSAERFGMMFVSVCYIYHYKCLHMIIVFYFLKKSNKSDHGIMWMEQETEKIKRGGFMREISKEFILARLGGELEKRLHENRAFQQQTQVLHKASSAFKSGCGMGKQGWKLYDEFEEEYSKYHCQYAEESFRLGFEDGLQMAAEHQIKMNKSVLQAKDMEHMVYLYDAAKKLAAVLLGEGEVRYGEGVLKDFDRIFQVIASGACLEIKMLGEYEAMEKIENVLENKEMSPNEKAVILAGLQETAHEG